MNFQKFTDTKSAHAHPCMELLKGSPERDALTFHSRHNEVWIPFNPDIPITEDTFESCQKASPDITLIQKYGYVEIEQINLEYKGVGHPLRHMTELTIKSLPELTTLRILNTHNQHGDEYLWDKDKLKTVVLQNLPKLKEITLPQHSIESIEQIGEMPELIELDLKLNNLTDKLSLRVHNAQNTQKFPKLTNLDVSYNRLTDLSELEGHTKLRYIMAKKNHISDFRGIRRLDALRSLDLSGNQLLRLNNITETKLQDMLSSNFDREERKGIYALPQLKTLNLKGNYLHGESIQDLGLDHLKRKFKGKKKHLYHVNLESNPLANLEKEIQTFFNTWSSEDENRTIDVSLGSYPYDILGNTLSSYRPKLSWLKDEYIETKNRY